MFKKIEELYKKESVYNKIVKVSTICLIVTVIISWILTIFKLGYLALIFIVADVLIIKIISEKILKTKLYFKFFPRDSFCSIDELAIKKEIENFKSYLRNKELYNKDTLCNIIEHYRNMQIINREDKKYLEFLLGIIPIAISFLSEATLENIVYYLIAIVITYSAIYYFYAQIKNIIKSLNGDLFMYERLEEIFSELLNDMNIEQNQIKKEKQYKKKKSNITK